MEIRIFEIHSLTVDLGVQLLVDGRECIRSGFMCEEVADTGAEV